MTARRVFISAVLMALLVAGVARAATMTIPAGTTLTVRMSETLDTRTTNSGDTFRAQVDAPVMINGQVAVPQGAEAIGRILGVEQAGRFRGRSVIVMELTALNFEGKSLAVLTNTYQESGDAKGKQTAKTAAGGGIFGTLVGALTGGKKGALIGGTVGAAGGAVVQAVRGGDSARIPAESLVIFTLLSPVSFETQF